MEANGKNDRNLGIDILRALAMFFVICWHLIGQGGVFASAAEGSGKYWMLSFLQILSCCAVDIYGITTGYLLCEKKFRLARLTKIWLTTVFWSVAVSCCLFLLFPETRTVSEMVSMFLPLLRGRYWFFTAYFVVMLISPALNLVINEFSGRQFRLLLVALFLIFGVVPVCSLGYDVLRISTGHHFAWMAVLYLIGGYLKKNDRQGGMKAEKTPARWLAGYFALAAVHMLYKCLMSFVGLGAWKDLLLTYPSPLILGEAVCLFLFFKEACSGIGADSMIAKIMKVVSPGVYAVYVIHVHPQVYWREDIIARFRAWDDWNTGKVCIALFGTAVAVFTACIVLDAVRQWLFRLLRIDRTADRLSDRIEGYIRARVK